MMEGSQVSEMGIRNAFQTPLRPPGKNIVKIVRTWLTNDAFLLIPRISTPGGQRPLETDQEFVCLATLFFRYQLFIPIQSFDCKLEVFILLWLLLFRSLMTRKIKYSVWPKGSIDHFSHNQVYNSVSFLYEDIERLIMQQDFYDEFTINELRAVN